MSKSDFPETIVDTNIEILYDKKKKDTGYRVAGGFAIKPFHLKDELPEFQTTSNELYIEHGAQIRGPLYSLIQSGIFRSLGDIELPNKKTYTKYEFYRPLMDKRTDNDDSEVNENDCLKFAESITSFVNIHENADILNRQLQQDTGPTILQYRDLVMKDLSPPKKGNTRTKRVYSTIVSKFIPNFGESNTNNRKLMKLVNPGHIDDLAIPNQGELYAIVRSTPTRDRSPYHIAYVIYSDDAVNITIEAEADNESEYQPKICIYDRELRNTFHCRWTGELYKTSDPHRVNYLYGNGRTVVLTMQDGIKNTRDLFYRNIIPHDLKEQVTTPIIVQDTNSRQRGRSSTRNTGRRSKRAHPPSRSP